MYANSIAFVRDESLAVRLDAAIAAKTKPPGSLGMLEPLAKQIGLIQCTLQPSIWRPAILVFAGDHGVVEEGVSIYPQSVTWQMVENFLSGGAAINVFARQAGCELRVIDAGVNHNFGPCEGLVDAKIAYGTRNFAKEPAMTREQCRHAMARGAALVADLPGNLAGFGEMGIGNTTAASALMHKLTGLPLTECVGAGAGTTAGGLEHKRAVIERAVDLHGALAPLDALATFGGFEIAMMVGAMLEAARRRMIVLIDGFIVTSALLAAARLEPAVLDYCVFSHCSDERGHRQMLAQLGAQPLLQLGLRLGEGSGCALALPLVQAAVNFLCEMATFDSARIGSQQMPADLT